MRISTFLGAAALATLAVAHPASAATNLVLNGGFESVTGGPTTGPKSHEFGASYIYGQTVDSWTSASPTAFNLIFYPGEANGEVGNVHTRFNEIGQYLHTSTLSPDGGNFVALDGDTHGATTPGVPIVAGAAGPLTQTVGGLLSGKLYDLSFYYAGAQYADRQGATTDQLFASLGGQTQYTPVFGNLSGGFTGWTKETFTFTADTFAGGIGSEVLSFLSNGAPSGLPPVILLDGVSLSLSPKNIVVPEPAAIAILGLGLAGIGAARLRRR